ncbi:hypothetical protein ACJ73_08049 [Blastomyces percursus]|uniref:Uncharacterized protein n=1 Tax=Blastomyces percursus TaxID=1658174 RepID=A0A1J9PW95_9EURO|nr:hypothetical protein ACJ73_08049 [Blastomyces percursus]
MTKKLLDKAEKMRRKLRDKIVEDANNYEGESKQYNSEEINAELKELVAELEFTVEDMDWTMWLFTERRKIRNEWRGIYIIPTYGKLEIVPGGSLEEGFVHISRMSRCWSRKLLFLSYFP